MNFNSTKRRSREKRWLVFAVAILILVSIASPFVFGLGFPLCENSAQAFDFSGSLHITAYNVGLGNATGGGGLSEIIGGVIYGILGLVGVLFLVLIVFAGFKWMTAGGNEETVAQAKKMITNGTIGVAIIILAYAITFFILSVVISSIGDSPANPVYEAPCCTVRELRGGEYYTATYRISYEDCANHCLGFTANDCQVVNNNCPQ